MVVTRYDCRRLYVRLSASCRYLPERRGVWRTLEIGKRQKHSERFATMLKSKFYGIFPYILFARFAWSEASCKTVVENHSLLCSLIKKRKRFEVTEVHVKIQTRFDSIQTSSRLLIDDKAKGWNSCRISRTESQEFFTCKKAFFLLSGAILIWKKQASRVYVCAVATLLYRRD